MTHTLSEYESKQLLADAGIPIPKERQVSSADEAVQAAERAVTEDRVPRRYHEAVKDYFQQLPEESDSAGTPAAPR